MLLWSAASFQISAAAAEMVGHEVAEQVLQNSFWPSKEAFAPEKTSLLQEKPVDNRESCYHLCLLSNQSWLQKTQESISMSRQNRIKPYIKKLM